MEMSKPFTTFVLVLLAHEKDYFYRTLWECVKNAMQPKLCYYNAVSIYLTENL